MRRRGRPTSSREESAARDPGPAITATRAAINVRKRMGSNPHPMCQAAGRIPPEGFYVGDIRPVCGFG